MKFPLSWLKEYLRTSRSAQEIARALTLFGIEVEKVTEEEGETLFEAAFTPNLGHDANLIGLAKALHALTEEPLTLPKPTPSEDPKQSISSLLKIEVKEPTLAPRFACRLLTDLKTLDSPPWLQKRLQSCGLRSVNAVVDITNYVLLECGQPLHAFDYAKIASHTLLVRRARKGEKLTALDHKEYLPSEEVLLISDPEKPLSLAGIMGGLAAEVTHETRAIVLEAATFDASTIRRASKQLGLHSDASWRFERGSDPNALFYALDRAAELLCQICGARLLSGTLEVSHDSFPERHLTCRRARLNRILGTQLALSEIETLFKRLELTPLSSKNEVIEVRIPTRRTDLQSEIDLIEEIARLYGYDNLLKESLRPHENTHIPHHPLYLLDGKARRQLLGLGLQELLTCDLISPKEVELIHSDVFPRRAHIHLLNPSSQDQSILRPTLLPNLLSVIRHNAAFGTSSFAGFEIGKVHFKTKTGYEEPLALAIVLTGGNAPAHWDKKERPFDFFDLKGIVENLLQGLRFDGITFRATSYRNFHPGKQAGLFLGDQEMGVLGELHPLTLQAADVGGTVLYAEINLEDLQRAPKKSLKMQTLAHFPAMSRDWTVTLGTATPIGRLFEVIEENRPSLLEEFHLIDLYQGEPLPNDKRNATFRFTYRDPKGTLLLKKVEEEHNRLTHHVLELMKGHL